MAEKIVVPSESLPPLEIDLLVDYVVDIAYKWELLGTKLGQRTAVKNIKATQSDAESKCLDVLEKWLESDKNVSWAHLVKSLRSIGLSSVAKQIEKDVGLRSTADEPLSTQAKELQNDLSFIRKNERGWIWRKESERDEKVSEAIDRYFTKHNEVSTDVEVLEKELKYLYEEEHLIPREAFDVSWERLQQMEKAQLTTSSSTPSSPDAVKKEVLFTKENIYHALVCCRALEQKDSLEYLKTGDCDHLFEAVSVTRDDCDSKHGGECHGRYLIARKRNVHFMAFTGIPCVKNWMNYDSFDEGLSCQSGLIPSNYLVQLLKDGSQIILTGMSFGGSLATAIVANALHDNLLLNRDLILESLACITFGQPVVACAKLDELISERDFLADVFHCIYTEEDVVPLLFKYCFYKRSIEKKDNSHSSVEHILKSTSELQMPSSQSGSEMSNTKKKAQQRKAATKLQSDISSVNQYIKEDSPPLPRCRYYVSKRSDVQGQPWEELTRERAIVWFSQISKDRMDRVHCGCFKLHTVEKYEKLIFHGHLDQPPVFSVPKSRPEVIIQSIDFVPDVDSVVAHNYAGDEVCVTVSGKNFWFARDLVLYKWKPEYINLRSNNYRQFQIIRTNGLDKELPKEVPVKLGSCFGLYKTLNRIPVTVQNLTMSTRQAQLAELRPVHLLQAGMLSVVLERAYGGSGTAPLYSLRYHAVREFIDKVIDAVPVESIAYILTFYSQRDGTILVNEELECVDILLKHTDLPSSRLFLEELQKYMRYNELHLSVRLRPEQKQAIRKMIERMRQDRASAPLLCGLGLEHVLEDNAWLSNPHAVIDHVRSQLHHLVPKIAQDPAIPSSIASQYNKELLELVKRISKEALTFYCFADAFMASQVKIPLVKSPQHTARALGKLGTSVGVWYLIGLNFTEMEELIKDRELVIDVATYLGKMFSSEHNRTLSGGRKMAGYDDKVKFIAQCMSQTVGCSAHYVSYSLECQLKELCSKCGITSATSIDEISRRWDHFFKEKILSFVAVSHRPVIARWIKWTLSLHELREALARQTVIGVVGIMNSGKSTLMNRIFHRQVPSGTRESKRTVVPFLYNLGPEIDELDVIDFPGVDDSDQVICDLCKILNSLSQLVIFVVDHRRAHSEHSMNWLKRLSNSDVPVLICLTFADRLYADEMNHMTSPDKLSSPHYPDSKKVFLIVEDERKEFERKYRETIGKPPPECMMCCLDLPGDSELSTSEGRRRLEEAGIRGHKEIAQWILDTLNRKGQCELADRLKKFLKEHLKTL